MKEKTGRKISVISVTYCSATNFMKAVLRTPTMAHLNLGIAVLEKINGLQAWYLPAQCRVLEHYEKHIKAAIISGQLVS